MINPETYYTVQGWMVSELGLKGNALAVYAIIYGFSQDGNSEYQGSARYLAEWLGCSRTTVMNTLKNLVANGYLEKRDIFQNGVCYCTYTSIRHPVQNLDRGCTETVQGVYRNCTGDVQNLDRGCTETVHNTTRDNYRDIDRDNNRDIEAAQNAPTPPPEKPKRTRKKAEKPPKPVKREYGENKNVLLTDDELQKLQQKFPKDWKRRIDDLSFALSSKGYKYESHYFTILNWARKDAAKAQAAPAANIGPNGITIDPTKTDMDGAFR